MKFVKTRKYGKSAVLILSAAIAASFVGCAKSNTPLSGEDFSMLSDPFAETSEENSLEASEVSGEAEIDADSSEASDRKQEVLDMYNKTEAFIDLISTGCGEMTTINNYEPLVYKGEPITVPVSVSLDSRNRTEMTYGLEIFINNTPQKLIYNGEETDMVFLKDLKAGETYNFEITLDPTVAETDLNASVLPIYYYIIRFPDFVPSPDYAVFVQDVTQDPQPEKYDNYGRITFESKPKTKTFKTVTDMFTPEIPTAPLHQAISFGILDRGTTDKYYQLVRRNDEGMLDVDVWVMKEPGKYRFTLYKNNHPIQFSDGTDAAIIEIKMKDTAYLTNLTIPAEVGDVIEVRFQDIDFEHYNFNEVYSRNAIVGETGYVPYQPW